MQWFAGVTQVAGLVVAVAALVISLHVRRDAKRKVTDMDAGMHSIAYREHILHLHSAGLTVKKIETVLRRETYRPGIPLTEANAYDDGYAPEVGTVREILDPVGKRQLGSCSTG
jgi:hypothetical protein